MQKAGLVKELTNLAAKVTGLPKEEFIVFLKVNDLKNAGIGGELLSDRNK